MKILALMTDAYGGHGGIAQYNRDLVGALCAVENVTAIEILPRSGPTAKAGLVPSAQDCPHPGRVKCHQSPAASGRLRYAVNALKLAIKQKPDLIFCGHIYMAPLAWALARLLRRPWWLQLHGIECWEPPSAIRRYVAERADRVTAVSRYTRRRFLAWANLAPHRIRVLPNTVGSEFTPGPKRPDLVERYGLGGKKVLLTVSRLSAAEQYKGHDRVIQAMPALLEQQPNCVYLIVGDGDDRPRLEQLAQSLGVRENVVFAGRVPTRELVDHFRLGDVFVMPSTHEGFGIVFVQAAMCGLAVVAGNVDGSNDAIADGRFGALVPPENPDALVESICAAVRRGARADTAGPGGRFNRRNFSNLVDRLTIAEL